MRIVLQKQNDSDVLVIAKRNHNCSRFACNGSDEAFTGDEGIANAWPMNAL